MNQKIIQVAGYSNSGKTTLVEKLVFALAQMNIAVGTIKHHGHGGELTSLDEGKDSWKHRQAGATVSSAVSKGNLQLQMFRKESWSAEEIIEMYAMLAIDVVVIEGFKASPFPKIVLIKKQEDVALLRKLENVVAAISWFPLTKEQQMLNKIPYFHIKDEEVYITYIVNDLRG